MSRSTKRGRVAAEDEIRARELYKYFRPPKQDGEAPDSILTAHAQLVSWRLGAQRAMITLIDEDIQYFVAESTKTLHLDDTQQHEDPDDAIWAGCVRVSKAGRLCEHTIAALPSPDGDPACFEVLDLSTDTRFNTLDFVVGHPKFRNYAGVPLRTRKGINIGSIFVIDSRIRSALTKNEWRFLNVVANNVIQHLEMTKDRRDSQRALKMSACMSAYVDPLSRAARRAHAESYFSAAAAGKVEEHDPAKGDQARLIVYERAAGLLLEGLDFVDHNGAVMFLDTLSTAREAVQDGGDASASSSSEHGSDKDTASKNNESNTNELGWIRNGSKRVNQEDPSNSTEVLAHADQSARRKNSADSEAARVNTLRPKDLSRLIKRYPGGKLFTFDSRGNALTSSSDASAAHLGTPKLSARHTIDQSKLETEKLSRCFPEARQIIFLPVWDSSTSRWAACFAYHGSEFRTLTYQSDFVYCATFVNAVVAELTKLASLHINQQQADFIASVSHELRSPLHGILASCEFLGDTEVTPMQQSFIATADSCARTLLDTINMVLDYSKINRFEESIVKTKQKKRDLSANSRSRIPQSHLSTDRTLDVAALAEEVVDGLAVGHAFETRLSRRNSFSVDRLYTEQSESRSVSNLSNREGCGGVEIILDIDVHDWTYCIEPGVLRRIIMVLVGNAIKFTTEGFVHVKLECKKSGKGKDGSTLTLTVSDSGRGIAPEFLETSIFSPFLQESTLTSGTGLGLPLVKSIVRALSGRVTISSLVGRGTKAVVRLPMVRAKASPKDIPAVVDFDNATERNRSTAITHVTTKARHKSVALYWHDPANTSSPRREATRLLQKSLVTYFSQWFGISLSPWEMGGKYDLVIATSEGLGTLRHLHPEIFESGRPNIFLALSLAGSSSSWDAAAFDSNQVVELGSPFGPSRLAHALKRCFGIISPPGSANSADHLPSQSVQSSLSMRTKQTKRWAADTALLTSYTMDQEPPQDDHQLPPDTGVDRARETARTDSSSIGLAKIEGMVPPSTEASACASNTVRTEINHASNTASSAISLSNEAKTCTPEPGISRTQTQNLVVEEPTVVKPSVDSGPRMLLVDDNAINLRLLQVYCKKLGYTNVHHAQDGQIALETYERLLHATPSAPPEVILMDLSMPIMDGFEATANIRKCESDYASHVGQTPRSFIVALTGLASVKNQKDAFAAGVDRYMIKPVKFANLSQLLEKWRLEGTDQAKTTTNEDGNPP